MLDKNPFARILLILFLGFPLLNLSDFYNHFHAHLTGGILTQVITNQWHIVTISIGLFLAFLIPLSYRRKANWVEYSLGIAFFVSLFIEMYGIPLTILFASKYLSGGAVTTLAPAISFTLLGIDFVLTLPMVYGGVMMILGGGLILAGWVTLYRNVKKGKFVTNGLYSFSRHPQYLGFILIILGWLIGWPTILTLVFAPILIYKYIDTCKKEEKDMLKENKKYGKYMEDVPLLI